MLYGVSTACQQQRGYINTTVHAASSIHAAQMLRAQYDNNVSKGQGVERLQWKCGKTRVRQVDFAIVYIDGASANGQLMRQDMPT